MVYFRVKPECDNFRRFKRDKSGRLVCDGALIGGQLFTRYEFIKLANSAKCFEQVTIPKNRTYFFFGVRFECESEVD